MKKMVLISLGMAACLLGTTPGFAELPPTSFQGEKITYAIKKFGLKAGEATLEFKGPRVIEGRELLLIVFRADGMNFLDEENIYVDPATFLPARVDRDINIFGKKEKITERYDAVNGTVLITKTAGDQVTRQTIKRNEVVDNIYCFIYRYRDKGNFAMNDELGINLPTQNVRITLTKRDKVKAGGEEYNAFFMESQPKKYRLWFADDVNKTPLRIDGAVGFGSTSMIMTGYEK